VNFIEKINNIEELYGPNIREFCTKHILKIRKENGDYFQFCKELKEGGIYQIKYDYGGLQQYKFVLCIENSKVPNQNGKLLSWCVNIHDITLKNRKFFFNNFFNEAIKKNENIEQSLAEPPFKIKPNDLYKYLKTMGDNYVIEPYNVLDIKEVRRVSTNILQYVLYFDSSKLNFSFLKSIRDKLDEQSPENESKKIIEELLEKYKELLDVYDDNNKEYHKKLKYFENNIKLYNK
jgi:hypothetical protein